MTLLKYDNAIRILMYCSFCFELDPFDDFNKADAAATWNQGNLSIGSFYIAIVTGDVRDTEWLVWFRDYYAFFPLLVCIRLAQLT